MSDSENDDLKIIYNLIKIDRLKSYFSKQSEVNLIRCEKCLLLSYIKSIKFDNNVILIYTSCRNNHEKKYELINYLNAFKEKNIENFLCYYKDNNKFNIETFIYCPECKIFFCQNCQNEHDKDKNLNHLLIKAKYMDFYCFEHIKPFKKFCLTCEKNICKDCEEKHYGDNIINFDENNHQIEKINDYYIKFEQNEINLNKIENYLKKSIENSNMFLMSLNYYKSKFYYLNDLLKNILLIYDFEKKSNKMNFELFYNSIFVLKNKKYLECNKNKLKSIKSQDDFNKYKFDLNNYPLKLNEQQIISKDYLFLELKNNSDDKFSIFNQSDYEKEISKYEKFSDENKKSILSENNLSSKMFNTIEKIIAIGAEKMNSKFCFSCYSNFKSNKNYIIYNDINRFLNIYSIEKRKNLRILKNLNNPDEDIYENVKSIKVFVDIVNKEKIVIFSTEQKSINKLKIYELNKYSLRNVNIFDNPINDFCFYNLDKESFIALNVQGKKQIDIIYKDGRNFRQLIDTNNDIENVQCMECCEGNVGQKTKIYLLVTGNNYLKSFDMNSYKLYKNYNINNKDSYIFSKFYITKDKFRIITSLKNGDLKLIDFNDPNSYEIFNPDKNTIPISSFNFLNVFYLFAATEDKKIKIFDLKKKIIINTYYFDNNIISLEIMPDLKNSFLYIYDDKGNIFEYSLNQF